VTASAHDIAAAKGRTAIGRKLALVGNPNVGKSVIFNALTGLNADVSNYPGTTIDIAKGRLGTDNLVDTPGIYGVSSFNDEERVARAGILEAQVIINIVSGLSLDRDLFLTLQLIDMGKPIAVVVNQFDEATARGLKIDIALLSDLLGVPVSSCVAVERKGIDEVRSLIEHARPGRVSQELLEQLQPLLEKGIDQPRALLLLEGDSTSATECGTSLPDKRAAIYGARRKQVNEIVAETVSQDARKQSFSKRLGHVLLHPVYGSAIAFMVCWLIFYQLLGVWIAGNLVDITEKKTMRHYYEPVVRRVTAAVFPSQIKIDDTSFSFPAGTLADPVAAKQLDKALAATDETHIEYDFWSRPGIAAFIGNAIAGPYGVLTLTVTYLIGLLMPLVLGFYFGLSMMEDSGYLPRLAVLVDRLMNKIGLNGRAIIPLILGLGCVTMATITTRLLTTRREKIIATALLGVAIPCSAQLGVVSGTLARAGGPLSWAIYTIVVFMILAATGLALNFAMPGQSGALIIDLPPMRFPRMDNVLKKTWKKSYNFLQESIPMFALAGFVVTVAQVSGILDLFIRLLQPLTVTWLQLPADPRIATTFILGIVRRDFAAFGLTDVAMTGVQAVTAMVVITLFVPCIATVGVMIKERGAKIALAIWVGSWICAFAIGGLLAKVLPFIFRLCSTSG
jgi:ferrous iron transport protein B